MARNTLKALLAAFFSLVAPSAEAQNVFPQFGPATGVLVGDENSPLTTAAVANDIIALWAGPCNSLTFLAGDGTCQPGTGTVLADPTAQVGLTPVNGVATSAMRSDAAPALDQGIAPTWTSPHRFEQKAVFTDSVADAESSIVFAPPDVTSGRELQLFGGQWNTTFDDSLKERGVRIGGTLVALEATDISMSLHSAQIGSRVIVAGLTERGNAILAAEAPPIPSYEAEVTDSTDTPIYVSGSYPSPWVNINGLLNITQDIDPNEATVYLEALIENIGNKDGTFELGISLDGAAPTAANTVLYSLPKNIKQLFANTAINANFVANGSTARLQARAISGLAGFAITARNSETPSSLRVSIVGSGSGAVGADPTATVALAPVNGVAGTFMRSDAAPPLSQAIVPTWTGAHTFNGLVDLAGPLQAAGVDGISGQVLSSQGAGLPAEWRTPGGGAIELRWNFSSAVGTANPGSQKMSLNSALFTSVTIAVFNSLAMTNFDANTILSLLQDGNRIYCQQRNDATKAVIYQVTGVGTNGGGFWTIPVSHINSVSVGTFPNNVDINCVFIMSASTSTSFGNPTATVGLTTINGVASTAMRSDAAPALDQAIIPTWTGAHTFSNIGTEAHAGALVIGAATGGSQGAGTVNATGLFVNGVAVGGGGGTPASPVNSVQFNNAGAFGGEADFLWDPTFNTLTLGSVGVSNRITPLATSAASGAEIHLRGGASTFAGGTGGLVQITAGAPTNGDGGSAVLLATAGAGTNRAGGVVSIGGGAATGTAAGGTVTITGGGSATGTAGTVNLRGGPASGAGISGGIVNINGGIPTDGNGGAVSIVAAAGVGTNRNGGLVLLNGGAGIGTGGGGAVSINGGAGNSGGQAALSGGNSTGVGVGGTTTVVNGGSATDGAGGSVAIQGANGTGTNRASGGVTIQSGGATGNATAGAINLTGGFNNNTGGTGAAINIAAGGGSSATGAGGQVSISAGPSTSGTPGNILLRTGPALTDRLYINANGSWGLGAAATVGTSGQILTSQGAAPPIWSTAAVTGLASPTSQIRLTQANGSALTAMRSDAAPALDVSITPTWSSQHRWSAAAGLASAPIELVSTQPGTYWNESDAAANAKTWRDYLSAGTRIFAVQDDGGSVTNNWLTVARTGAAVSTISLGNATDNPPYSFLGTGTVTSGGVRHGPLGAVSAPTYSFTGDSNTGMYNLGVDQLAFSTNSTERLQFNASGAWGLSGANFGTAGQVLTSQGNATSPTWTTVGGGVTGLANPTATIGLTAVNGSATTAMRSDAAPLLSQAIAPTWTGSHLFTGPALNHTSSGVGIGVDVSPKLTFGLATGGVDEKSWDLNAGATFSIRTINDAATDGRAVIGATRSGFAVTSVNIGNATDSPVYSFLGTGATAHGGVIRGPNASSAGPTYSFTGDLDTGIYRVGADALALAAGAIDIAYFRTDLANPSISIVGGSAAIPALNFFSDTNTGFYTPAADTIAFATGGADSFRASNGRIHNGDGSLAFPAYSFINDTDTGLFRTGSDELRVGTGGVLAALFSAGTRNYLGGAPFTTFANGTSGNPAITFESDQDTGFYANGLNALEVVAGATRAMQWNASSVIPLLYTRTNVDGDATNPTYAFNNETTTGIYRVGTGIIGFSATGTNTARIVSASGGGIQVADYGGTLQTVGFREIPQNSQSANYTTIVGDSGKHIFHPSGGGAGDVFTIQANATVAYPIGTTITFVNRDSNAVSIAITSDTLILGGTATTGTRTLGQNGVATAIKVESTVWIITGTGLT